MGNHASKKSKKTSAKIYATELRSYEDACKADTELQSFDTCLQTRTSDVINTLAMGVDDRALSLDSLKQVTECLLEMNQDVVKVILNCKDDIWNNEPMFDLVKDYLETSLKTLDFCAALEKGLGRARNTHIMILVALKHLKDETIVQGGNGYKKTLEELKNFKDAENPFDEDFFKMFQSLYKQQMLLLEKLQLRMKKLHKKLKHIHTWRKLSSIIFVATFATVLICSVVAAAMAVPPVAAALAAATALPLGSMGKWIDSLWKKYENATKGQKEVISSMQTGTYVTLKDLRNIRIAIEQLEADIREMVKHAEGVEHNTVKIGINEIEKKLEGFHKNVKELGIQADLCRRDIMRARTVVLQRILKQHN